MTLGLIFYLLRVAVGGTLSSAEENDNSLTSFEGIFLNGVDLEAALSESSKIIITNNKPIDVEPSTKPRSQMLADLLDKKDSPLLNGVIGEKGLELVEKAILADKPVVNNNGVVECGDSRTSGAGGTGGIGGTISAGEENGKRPAPTEVDLTGEEPVVKRPRTEPSAGQCFPEIACCKPEKC